MFGQPESKHHLKQRGTKYFTKPSDQGSGSDHVHTPLWGSLAILGRKPVPHHGKGGLFQLSFYLFLSFIFSVLSLLIFYHLFLSSLILSYLILSFSPLVKILLIVHLSRPSPATTPWTFPTSSTCPTRGKTSSRSCWCSTPPRGTQRPRPYNTPG